MMKKWNFNHGYDTSKAVSIINCRYKAYLIGSMESPAKQDDGIGWRRQLTPDLNKRGIYCFDPTKEEVQKVGMPTAELLEKLKGWQLSGNWGLFINVMRKIWRGTSQLIEDPTTKEEKMMHVMGDVDYVENSDFLIWTYHDGDKLGGTIAELVIAWYRGIPTYLITDVAKTVINKSLLYFVLDSGHGKGKIFHTQGELLSFLDGEYRLNIIE